MTSPAADPATYKMSVTEDLVLPFDITDYLVGDQVPASATSSLTDLSTGATVELSQEPTIAGNTVSQRIIGSSELVDGHSFLLIVNFTASPNTNVWAVELTIIAVP